MDNNCKDCVYIQRLEERLTKVETAVEKLDKDEREQESRLTKVEGKVDDIKEDIREIKDHQSKMMLWLIGIMGTSIVSLLVLVFNIVSK